MSSNVIVKVLLLLIFIHSLDAPFHERAEEQRQKKNGVETDGIAIDILYKSSTNGYTTFADVVLVSFGFVLGATAILVYRLVLPKRINVISTV